MQIKQLHNALFLTICSLLLSTIGWAQPSNDNCGGSILLTVTSNCNPTAGNSSGATQSQSGCTGNADDDVWYRFVANGPSLAVTVSANGNGYDPVFQVFSGTCGGSSIAGCNNSSGAGGTESTNLNNLFNGVTYWIRVYHAGTGGGNGGFNICVHEPVVEPGCDPNSPEPANSMNPCPDVPKICNVDGFCGTTQGYHPTPGGSMTPYTVDTWNELSTAFCGSIENNSFFKFTANASSVQLRIYGSCSSGTGIQMLAFELNAPAPGTCNNGPITSYGCISPVTLQPSPASGVPLSFTGMTPGNTYYIMVDGFAGAICDYKIGADFGVQLAVNVSPSNKDICLGNSVNLVASGGDGNYTWEANPELSTLVGPNTTATPTALGVMEYVVTSTATDPDCPNSNDTSFINVTTTPAPDAGMPDSICFGETLTLNGTISEPTNSTLWQTFAPGINPPPTPSFSPNFSVEDPVVTVNQPGVYYFIFRETSQLCGQYKDTVEVHVIEPVQTLLANAPSCAGQSDGQIQVVNQYGEEYSYDGGNTWVTSDQQGGFAAGTYTVCSRNYLGCDTCTQVTVPEGPQIGMTVGNDTIICENGTATLQAFGFGGQTFTYHWDHTTDLAGNQPVSPTQPQYYPVYAENEGGCISNTDSIYVDLLPDLQMQTSLDTAICPGEIAYLEATGAEGNGGPYNFDWSHGASSPNTNGQDMQPVSPTQTTTYTVTLTDNCESSPVSMDIEVVVSPLPQPEFVVTEDSVCEPAVFEIANSTDPALTEDLFWELSDGQVFENLETVYPEALSHGSYGVSLTVTSPDGCVNTTIIPQFLHAMVKPDANFRSTPSPVKMFNTAVTLSNLSIGAEYYEWIMPGATPSTSNQTDVDIKYPDGVVDNYPVELVATSDFGCSDTSRQIVEVLSEVVLYVPNTFTPNGDAYNNTWSLAIDGIDASTFEVQVFNRWGAMIYQSNDINFEWDGTVNGEVISTGLYSFKVHAEDATSTEKYDWSGFLNILR